MMIKLKKVLPAIGFVLIGAVLGASLSLYFFYRMISNDTVLDQSNALMKHVSLLKEIRAGETTRAVDTLESYLDGNLIFFAFDHKVNALIEHRALEALKEAREYRKEYPRTTNNKEVDEALSKALSEKTNINKK